jgi:predicted glutamine amidotransferase
MCGLLGIAAHRNTRLTPELAGYLATQLVFKNESRGGDSFGLGLVTPEDKGVRMFKTVGRISQKGVYERSWANGVGELIKSMSAGKTTVALGHNRKATTGANTVRNAHPFLCGKPDREDFVLGAHNGFIAPWNAIKNAWEIKYDMEVDSEVIFRGIQKHIQRGSDGTVDLKGDVKVLSQLSPMSAISATYMKDMQTLNLYRGDNPLAIAKGDGFVIWSSVDLHLKDVLLGLNVDIVDLAEGTLLQLDLDTFKTVEVEIEPDFSLKNSMFPKKHTYLHGRSEGVDRRGLGVVVGDKRSSTGFTRSKESGESLRHIFRSHNPDLDSLGSNTSADGVGCSLAPIPNRPVGTPQSKSVEKYIFSLVPDTYVTEPRDRRDIMECASCEHQQDPKGEPFFYEKWQLMWHGPDGLCPVCHYYMVQADAEKQLANNRHHAD